MLIIKFLLRLILINLNFFIKMKFGRQFDFHKIPEWSEFYLDYKELKNCLKFIQKSRRKCI